MRGTTPRKTAVGKDLFGNPVYASKTQNQMSLERFDARTLAERTSRLRFLRRIVPQRGFLMPVETMMVFTEAKMTFISGAFISTVLLASAFIEHRLGSYLDEHGFRKEAKAGLGAIIKCARDNGLASEFLLAKAEHIQKIRNPFVHLKPHQHPHNLSQRAWANKNDWVTVMEADAKEALSTMYAIAICRFGKTG